MTDYFCRICGYVWASIGASLWCPKCETNDIQEDNDNELVSKG